MVDNFYKIIEVLKTVRLYRSVCCPLFCIVHEKTFRVIQNDVPRIGQQQE